MRDPVTSDYVRVTGLFAEAGIVCAIPAGRQAEFGLPGRRERLRGRSSRWAGS